MLLSILALLTLPYLDLSNIRGNTFKPLMKISFWIFIANFFVLMKLGSLHVEEPFITMGQISTAIYFSWFFLAVPIISCIEKNTFTFKNNPYKG
jgi:ubiquinol-cytochrome c reductase cytochrome b subunit